MIYAETSVLISLVLHDIHTDRALGLTAASNSALLFNSLLRLEVCNAIRLNVAAGTIDEVVASASVKQIEEFLRRGMLESMEPDWEKVFLRSIGFSNAHSSIKRTRSFDILHVAAAVELGATEFWSFDKRQRALAEAVGLRINP